MKVFKVQSPSASASLRRDRKPEVQSGAGRRAFSNLGRWALEFVLRPSRLGGRNGVALVITLIMLSIITFMTVTFLVLSQRERNSVSTATDQKIARDASDAALSRVSAELLTRMMLHTNFQDFDLLVSTNYINYNGLHGGVPGSLSPTNVNYDYLSGGTFAPLTPQDHNINIASLLFNPRPPVYVITNAGTGESEFRYYLDLNRNGRFDANGGMPVVVTTSAGLPSFVTTNGVLVPTNLPIAANTYLVTNNFVGDPEWIGVLARPQELHSVDNLFIARYAYVVQPVGKTLDINTMHNQAFTKSLTGNDGYMRNQGVGPWELNLAGALTDLNTNIWPGPKFPGYNPLLPYDYESPFGLANTGLGFQDALSILSYRYNNNYNTLFPANQLFNTPAQLASDNIDEYSDGPIMTTTTNNLNETITPDLIGQPWLGAENTNHYFSPQDLFDRTKVGAGFSGRLQQAGTSNDSHNAYTFYRMLAQIGTDSAPEQNKLNINYKNTDVNGNIVPGMETNHMPWPPEDFFTNAANRILAQFTNQMGVALSTKYIPIYPTNYYTPSVHRALQLAANIFDAATNQTVALTGQTNAFFPSVFRPVFTSQNGQVWISGYKEVVDTNPLFNFQFWDFNTLSNSPGTYAAINVYGVPWVVGAKKGFPNFNQFNFQTVFQLTRRLKLTRLTTMGDPPLDLSDFKIQQEFVMNAQNSVHMHAWNSYNAAWPMTSRKLRLYGTNIFSTRILNSTNVTAVNLINPQTISLGSDTLPVNWPGYASSFPKNGSLKTLISSTNGIIDGNTVSYDPTVPSFLVGEHFNQTVRPIPPFYIYTTNRMLYALIDESTTPNRIVDFVNLDDSGRMLDLTGVLETQAQAASVSTTQPMAAPVVWRTNQIAGPLTPDAVSDGINYQLQASLGQATIDGWNGANPDPNNGTQITTFRNWVMNSPIGGTNQTPFTPTFGITNEASWEANDPLVHYTIPDLTDPVPLAQSAWPPPNNPNHRYRPWNNNTDNPTDSSVGVQAMAKKDAGLTNSDAWDFPTNKFWNVGILGRVHRGTPWQTVYMKSPIIAQKDWVNWSGNLVIVTNALTGRTNADATVTTPVADYQLFDLFTTSPNPSASRGQLNINQTNLAAWSAVLAGVNVVTNAANGTMGSTYIPPAGVYDPANPTPLVTMWQGILRSRTNTDFTKGSVFPNRTFQHEGDVLAVPELTAQSPYAPPSVNGKMNPGANDEVYERIPQQIMSLLTLNQAPRFVIYSFGQTLHPAEGHPLVNGGTFNGLCTNYQVTAESATRAVVRVEGTSDPRFQGGRVDSQGRSYPPHLVVEQFNLLSPD